jgi:hypothetical protein
MEDMAPKGRLRRVATLMVCAAGLSCGTGLRDGNNEESVSRMIGPEGGQIAFMEGTLDIPKNSVGPSAVSITLHRYPSIKHTGAISPVFEIQVPKPETFTQDPTIGISTTSSVVVASNSAIGYLVPILTNVQWMPDQTPPEKKPSCQTTDVCDFVQCLSFTNPANLGDAGTTTQVLQFAIVQRCTDTEECLKGLACNSGACQECPLDSKCSSGTQSTAP